MKLAVIIPCYRVKAHILQVLQSIPENVDHIFVVDDACPEQSGKLAETYNDPRVEVIFHSQNQGVGGAMITGYRRMLETECDVAVKMDGDGQMDARFIPQLIDPIVKGQADYTKGNRFFHFRELRQMPRIRLFGNSALSFVLKLVSGYWNMMDPTNGFTAIHRETIRQLELDKLDQRYFFESDMLVQLNITNAVVQDVPMPAKYEDEKSSMQISRILLQFPAKLLRRFCKRIFLKYFIYDFNMASVYLLLGIPLFVWGTGFGLMEWMSSHLENTPRSAGTIMLSALPLIVSSQMLLQAIQIDINNVPKKKP
ncbi:MAG: glycosyltransferase family 2 protein [SAR324 cluster bacterium]|nr:glycosyltransferase family 2 protein [SAR324 cluster bacterium]